MQQVFGARDPKKDIDRRRFTRNFSQIGEDDPGERAKAEEARRSETRSKRAETSLK